MSKITKLQLKRHEQAEEMLWGSDKKLTPDEVVFCLTHWGYDVESPFGDGLRGHQGGD